MPPNFDFDRFTGMMLGLAVGDALGNTTEGFMKFHFKFVWERFATAIKIDRL